jgi:hypothetical protein
VVCRRLDFLGGVSISKESLKSIIEETRYKMTTTRSIGDAIIFFGSFNPEIDIPVGILDEQDGASLEHKTRNSSAMTTQAVSFDCRQNSSRHRQSQNRDNIE